MSEYIFNEKRIKELTAETEMTSAIATIAYEIENAKYHGVKNKKIIEQLKTLKEQGKFPPQLEFVDVLYDSKTSLCVTAFKNTTTGNITLGFAGTNFDNGGGESLKDVSQWAAIAFSGDAASAAYFAKGNQFIQNLKQEGYVIDTVTGHSLGGRNGAILGMKHQIPNMIFYNAAPLSNTFGQAIATVAESKLLPDNTLAKQAFNRGKNSYELRQLIENYQGNLMYIVSEKDPLNNVAGLFNSLYPEEIFVIENGRGHEMSGFLSKEEQAFIKTQQAFRNKKNRAYTSAQLTNAKIKSLRGWEQQLRTKNGGLSAGQEIFLDAMEGKAITEGMRNAVQEELRECKKMYEQGIEEAHDLWRHTQADAGDLGAHLTYGEILEALAAGNVTESQTVREPVAKYEEALSKLTTLESHYTTLLKEIDAAIQEQVAADQTLAGLFQ